MLLSFINIVQIDLSITQ